MVGVFYLNVGDSDVVVNMPDRHALMEQVRTRMRQGAGFAVATLNLDHMVKLRRFEPFRRAYALQDLVTADGNPIVWLSRLAGQPVRLVTGSDLVEPLAGLAAEEQVPVALLGSTEETLRQAAEALVVRNPGLQVVACLAPPQGFSADSAEADRMIAALQESGARLTFLALGAPKQEMFAARCRAVLPGMGLVSVGAGLDFIAQSQRRAPRWMQQLALEWVWRMLVNPRRMAGRYASCALVFPWLVMDVIVRGRARSAEADFPVQL